MCCMIAHQKANARVTNSGLVGQPRISAAMKCLTSLLMTSTTLFLWFRLAQASNFTPTSWNETAMKGQPVHSDDKLVKIRLTDLNRSDWQTQKLTTELTFFRSPEKSKSVVCSFPGSKPENAHEPLACGLWPLGSIDDSSGSIDWLFLVRERRPGWLGLPTADGKNLLWLSESSSVPGTARVVYYETTVIDLPALFANQGLQPLSVGQKVTMKEQPDDSAKAAADCSWANKVRRSDMDGVVVQQLQGDWVKVTCHRISCFVDDAVARIEDCEHCDAEPGYSCDKDMKELQSQLPACPSGWLRWRSPDGHWQAKPVDFASFEGC